jgi:hypothetical protein
MKRPGYREAITWLALNDDCEWLTDDNCNDLSVSACLVADLFGIKDDKVRSDLRRVLNRRNFG